MKRTKVILPWVSLSPFLTPWFSNDFFLSFFYAPICVEIIEAMACQTARVLLLVLLGHSLYIIYVIKFNASDLCVQQKIINSDVDSILC